MAGLFGVGLVALEVVDGRLDRVAGRLAGADGVDGVADHLQGLERDHDLVILDEVAGEQQDALGGHG